MRTLVIDCATSALSLALFDRDICVSHRHAELGRGHAEALVPQLAEMLGSIRADGIAVDVGPGSFTGIRVGLAAARALGLAWDVPVRGFGCLSLCAAIVRKAGVDPDVPLAIVMTGGHGELFWQHFDPATLAPVAPVASTPVAELAASLADAVLHGSGAQTLVDVRGWGEAISCLPDARAFPLLPESLAQLPPAAAYGRGADAKPLSAQGTQQRTGA